jgi:hypothetical protein
MLVRYAQEVPIASDGAWRQIEALNLASSLAK